MSGLDDTVVHGSHDQYVVVDDHGSLHLEDSVSGRDGTQTHSGIHRVQFTDGVGVFDPSGTAEDVSRLYLAALHRAPDVDGLEAWTDRIDNSHVSLENVANSFAASPEFIHTYGALSDTAFVQQLYHNVLDREGESSGVQAWQNALASGVSRGEVVLGFAESRECRAKSLTFAGDKDDAEAFRLYQTAFNRTPDEAGHSFWSSALAHGATPLQVAQSFVDSAEFEHTYGALSNSDFVSALYTNALHRPADAAGQQAWTNVLQQGGSRASVLIGFSDSQESRGHTAGATHDGWVFIHA